LGDQSTSLLRGQLADIILGTVFLFFGLTACAIAAIRKRTEVRILIWLGIWSGMYGTNLLARSPAVVAALTGPLQIAVPYLINAITYLIAVAALLAWTELNVGQMRLFTRAMAALERQQQADLRLQGALNKGDKRQARNTCKRSNNIDEKDESESQSSQQRSREAHLLFRAQQRRM
jgi:hypothetical protein